jgi:PAS domain S-box-containing protein
MDASTSLDQLDKPDLIERCLLFQKQLKEQKTVARCWVEALTKLVPTHQHTAKPFVQGLRFMVKTLDMDGGYIHLFDETEHRLRLSASVGLSRRAEDELRTLHPGEGVPGQVLQKAEPLVATNITQISDLSGKVTQAENRMLHAGFPLPWKDSILGTLTVVSKRQTAFTEEDVSLLKAFSEFMGVVIRNSTLFEIVSQAKRQWEDAFDSISDLVVICDRDFRILKTNKAILERFWFPLEDAIGKECFELLYDGNPFPVPRENLERMLRQGVTYSEEVSPVRQGGLFSIFVSPILTSGKLSGSIHVIKEITHERLPDQNRDEPPHKVSRPGPGTIGIDREGKIRSWDSGAEAVLGYDEKDMRGQPLSTVLPSPEIEALFDDLKTRGGVLDFETTMTAKGRRPVLVSATLAARWDKKEQIKEVTLLIRHQFSSRKSITRSGHDVRMNAMIESAAALSRECQARLEDLVTSSNGTEKPILDSERLTTQLTRLLEEFSSVQEILGQLYRMAEVPPQK